MISSVCVFGDSVGKGVVFDSVKKKYLFLKDSFIDLFRSKVKVPVTNYSKFGCTVKKANEIIEKHADEISAYDYILLEFGGNDSDFNWKEISEDPDALHLPKTPIKEFEAQYRNIFGKIREKGGNPVLLSLPPVAPERYFEWISKGLSSENILHWLGDVNMIYRWHEMYNMAVCRLAVSEQIPLIDVRSAFLCDKNYRDRLCEDGIHPNEKGHELIYDTILSVYRTVA